MLIEKLVVGSFGANCYLLGCEKSSKGIVIDPGDEVERVQQKIRQMEIDVEKIILTHGHPDHISAATALKEATGAVVMMHPDDTEVANNRILNMMLGIKTGSRFEPDEHLFDGQKIEVGGVILEVIHTPGHSRGSVCLVAEGVVFTGDLLFAGGIGRCDLPGGDEEKMAESLKKIVQLDEDVKVYPGHGPSTTIGAESRGNIYLDGWV